MIDLKEFKKEIDRINYDDDELEILRESEVLDGEDYYKLLRKTIRLGDTEKTLSLLKYV